MAGEVRWLAYPIVGSTLGQLRAAMALLGPRRGGIVHPAYVDWQLSWSLSPQRVGCAFRVHAPEVAVTATVTMPVWRPPRSASAELVGWWEANNRALRRHEQGHVDLAAAAAAAASAALGALGAEPTAERLHAAASRAVQTAVATYRRRERAYDAATGHGRTQGVVLAPSDGLGEVVGGLSEAVLEQPESCVQ